MRATKAGELVLVSEEESYVLLVEGREAPKNSFQHGETGENNLN